MQQRIVLYLVLSPFSLSFFYILRRDRIRDTSCLARVFRAAAGFSLSLQRELSVSIAIC